MRLRSRTRVVSHPLSENVYHPYTQWLDPQLFTDPGGLFACHEIVFLVINWTFRMLFDERSFSLFGCLLLLIPVQLLSVSPFQSLLSIVPAVEALH